MFGIGGSEIIVILVLALLFLGPDKMPEAAKTISKHIRELKRHGRTLQRTIEDDEHIGGAIRDLKSAMRGDEMAPPPPLVKRKRKKKVLTEAQVAAKELAATLAAAGVAPDGSAPEHDPNHPDHGAPPDPTAIVTPDVLASERVTDAATVTEIDMPGAPAMRLPISAGERDHDDHAPSAAEQATEAAELAAMIRPAAGTIAKGANIAVKAEPERG